jgi:aspartate/methionine/tyrosine aminotransferase
MQAFALGDFLTEWAGHARHDLSASDSDTFTLRELLAMAQPEDQQRWETLPLGYGDPRGAVWLRQAIAETYTDASEDTLLCFAGAQDAMTCVAQALLSPRDHAIVVVPCYPPSEATVALAAPCTGVALDAAHGWSLDLDRVAAAIQPNTRMVVTNFPNNPTGALMARRDFNALIALCRRHGLWLVNDEVYRLIDRNPAARLPQVADVYERGVSINGISKSFGLPGLRVGWAACRDQAALERMAMARNVLSGGLAVSSEVLAHIALRAQDRILTRNRAIAEVNLRLLRPFMAGHADWFGWTEPSGGVTAFPRYRGAGSAKDFAATMVREAGVLVLPGCVWHSALATVPDDRIRVGFGKPGMGAALAAWDTLLAGRESLAPRSQEAVSG